MDAERVIVWTLAGVCLAVGAVYVLAHTIAYIHILAWVWVR